MTDLSGLSFVQAPAVPDTANILLYGPPKAGKSTAAATAPGPIMWLNLEGPGALGYARKVAAERGHAIHEVRPERTAVLKPVLNQIYAHVASGVEPKVQTVVVDTIGKVRDQLVRNIGGEHPQIQHWGEVAKIIEGFVATMRDLPIAYCGRVEDEEHGVRYMGVLAERNGRRAGDRSGTLGVARELDLTEWLEAYRAGLTPDESDLPFADAFDGPPLKPVEDEPGEQITL